VVEAVARDFELDETGPSGEAVAKAPENPADPATARPAPSRTQTGQVLRAVPLAGLQGAAPLGGFQGGALTLRRSIPMTGRRRGADQPAAGLGRRPPTDHQMRRLGGDHDRLVRVALDEMRAAPARRGVRLVAGHRPHIERRGVRPAFQRQLGLGEKILVEPGGFLYKDSSVTMNAAPMQAGGSFGKRNWAELAGPGRVGIQSMYHHSLSTW